MNEILSQEKSIYIQIREMIENDILRDILLEEERVPSTNELAKAYAINPATAARELICWWTRGFCIRREGSACLWRGEPRRRLRPEGENGFLTIT